MSILTQSIPPSFYYGATAYDFGGLPSRSRGARRLERYPMAIQAGLVGLPNVGKSTLFNALTKSSVLAENYPFATIDPSVAITEVPDPRLRKLADIFKSEKLIPTTVQFVDIAGLVRGAAEGEGLGNQFLSHIMGVDLILHVLRVFENDNIIHVNNAIDPLDDFNTVMAELMLKDLESIEKRHEKLLLGLKNAQTKQLPAAKIKELEAEKAALHAIEKALASGNWQEVQRLVKQAHTDKVQLIPLLTGKNFLIIANVSEQDFVDKNYLANDRYNQLVEKFGKERVIAVSAQIESELSQLSETDADEMMDSLGLDQRGLDDIISKSYSNLNLITFFTCGPKEAHAWSIPAGLKVPQASGYIHSDLERGFICAEVFNCEDLFVAGSEHGVKLAGKLRVEGKEYIVQDGDLLNVRFNV